MIKALRDALAHSMARVSPQSARDPVESSRALLRRCAAKGRWMVKACFLPLPRALLSLGKLPCQGYALARFRYPEEAQHATLIAHGVVRNEDALLGSCSNGNPRLF